MANSKGFRRVSRLATLLAGLSALAGCADIEARPTQSDVQEIGGKRVDVPARDLAPNGSGLLRNGLTPQPQEFD